MKKLIGLLLLSLCGGQDLQTLDFSTLERFPADLKGVELSGGKAAMTGDKWGFLLAHGEQDNFQVEATLSIQEQAKKFGFFGQSWSVWPDLTYSDQGFEAAILLRGGKDAGYRVQLSHALQQVALVKYPSGGYLRSVPCVVKLKEAQIVSVAVQGTRLSIRVDGQEKIAYQDTLRLIPKGRIGIGASSGAKVAFEKLTLRPLSAPPADAPAPHVPNFSARSWLGGRPWIFDGDEPILMLVSDKESYINNVKLRPGFKPLLSWNSYWETSNQGAFPEGAAKPGNATVMGGGKSLTATWTANSVKGRFIQQMKMVVGWDERRGTYTYDVDGELEVLPGEPFTFKYGYDF